MPTSERTDGPIESLGYVHGRQRPTIRKQLYSDIVGAIKVLFEIDRLFDVDEN